MPTKDSDTHPQLAVASQGEREGAAELRRLRLHRVRLFPDNLHGTVKRARRAAVAVVVRRVARQQRRELLVPRQQHQAGRVAQVLRQQVAEAVAVARQ
jgi:hypothetical protein